MIKHYYLAKSNENENTLLIPEQAKILRDNTFFLWHKLFFVGMVIVCAVAVIFLVKQQASADTYSTPGTASSNIAINGIFCNIYNLI